MKVSLVSYLNSRPFHYGLLSHRIDDEVELTLDNPAVCAMKLATGQVDLGLVPVAVIPEIVGAEIVSDYCIGANGAVGTVCIYSNVPMQEIKHLYLDYQSRTSVELARFLLKKHWKHQVELLPSQEGYEYKIVGTTAGLVIGDRAIELTGQFPYVYDLALYWKQFSGLPFVFAAWVSNKKLPTDFLERFNDALAFGVDRLEQVALTTDFYHPNFNLLHHYTKQISYNLDTQKKEGLNLFLDILNPERKTWGEELQLRL
jgi:chorismate dehydratase